MAAGTQDRYQGKTRREYKRMKAYLPGNSNPGKNKVVTCQSIPIVDAGRASTLFCYHINKRVFYSRAYLYGDEYGEDMIYNDEYGLKLHQIT